MTGRERFLLAINNKKPDRLPCQVHNWMPYYLNRYLNGYINKEITKNILKKDLNYQKKSH